MQFGVWVDRETITLNMMASIYVLKKKTDLELIRYIHVKGTWRNNIRLGFCIFCSPHIQICQGADLMMARYAAGLWACNFAYLASIRLVSVLLEFDWNTDKLIELRNVETRNRCFTRWKMCGV